MAEKLSIAYITGDNPLNKRSWSGSHFSIYTALNKHIGAVDVLGPYSPTLPALTGKLMTGLAQQFGKRYDYRHSRAMAKAYAQFFSVKLKQKNYDLIVAPSASCEIAWLKTNIPIVYISDTTFLRSLNYHKALSNLLPFSVREGYEVEKKALDNSRLVMMSSSWAAQSVIHDFHIPPERILVQAFGANMELLPTHEELLNKPTSEICRLLFMGVYWENKGGEIAWNCLLELLKMGINAELTVCGCTPPEKFRHEKLRIIPFIDKNNEEGRKALFDLFMHHDFLVLPTRFDCTPIVFCEASAFGIPSVSANTGGVSGHVFVGENGFLIDFDDKGAGYAKKIAEVFSNKTALSSLRKSARNTYENYLNWDSWALALKKKIESW